MIIDTNVYSALNRNKGSSVRAIAHSQSISIPFCVLAELKFGFLLGKNTNENQFKLEKFMSQSNTETLIVTLRTIEIYADIAKDCRVRGKSLSQNDLWIAALAIEHDEQLLTYDKDFLALTDRLGEKLVLLED